MDRIYLTLIRGTWHATFVCADAANTTQTLKLFGTLTLPTPYSASTPAARVLGAFQKTNQDAIVELIEVIA